MRNSYQQAERDQDAQDHLRSEVKENLLGSTRMQSPSGLVTFPPLSLGLKYNTGKLAEVFSLTLMAQLAYMLLSIVALC